MPHKAQLMLKLAQVAQVTAREGRQVPLLPQVASNVWDSLQGQHEPATAHTSSQQPADALAAALSRLNLLGQGLQGGAAGLSASELQQFGRWAALSHPELVAGRFPQSSHADSRALRDAGDARSIYNPAHAALLPFLSGAAAVDTLGMLPAQHAAALRDQQPQKGQQWARPGLKQQQPQQDGFRRSDASSSAAASSSAGGFGSKRARYNNSVSLNKMIMGAYTSKHLLELVRDKGCQFDFFNISSAIARIPKLAAAQSGGLQLQLDTTAKALIDELSELMCKHMDTFDARGLANAIWAFGKMKYVPSHKLPALIAEAAIGKMDQFSAQNLSNMLWSLVYLHYSNEELLKAAADQVRRKVALFKPQELSNVVWALASMEHHDAALMDAVAQRCLVLLDQFKEQELSNVLWAYGKLKHYDRVLFLRLLGAVAAKLPTFQPQGISNIAWALAVVNHRDPALFDQLVGHCLADMSSYDVQGLSNLLWACAIMGHRDRAFIEAVAQECAWRVDKLSPQHLSNVLWSCASLGHGDPQMLDSWASAISSKLDSFEPQGLSNVAWAFAKLGYSHPQLFQDMGLAAENCMDGFTAQGLSNLAWAYATVGQYQPQLMQRLAAQVVENIHTFNVQNCSVTAWAFATLRHDDSTLMDALLGQLAANVAFCEPQNIANLLWALARLGRPLGVHGAALTGCAAALLPRMQQQELGNTVWALAALELLDVPTWRRYCECLSQMEDIPAEGLHQAYHTQLMLQASEAARRPPSPARSSSSSGASSSQAASLEEEPLLQLPAALHEKARALWRDAALDVRVSRLQQSVSSALTAAGVPHAMEWLTDDGLFSIDIALTVHGRPVALEVDGAHHYTNSMPPKALSDVSIRRRLLRHRGWAVVNMGYQDWAALQGNPCPTARLDALTQLVAAELGVAEVDWRTAGEPTRASSSVFVKPGGGLDGALLDQQAAGAAGLGSMYPLEGLGGAAGAVFGAQLQQQQQLGGLSELPWDLQQGNSSTWGSLWGAPQQFSEDALQQLLAAQGQLSSTDASALLGWGPQGLGAGDYSSSGMTAAGAGFDAAPGLLQLLQQQQQQQQEGRPWFDGINNAAGSSVGGHSLAMPAYSAAGAAGTSSSGAAEYAAMSQQQQQEVRSGGVALRLGPSPGGLPSSNSIWSPSAVPQSGGW